MMKFKRQLKRYTKKLYSAMNAYVLTAAVMTSTLLFYTQFEKISLKGALTQEMVVQMMNENESYLKSNYLEGLMSNFHEDFVINIEHATGRKETLNKSQYLKQFEIVDLLGMEYSLTPKVLKYVQINRSSALVTLTLDQSFTNKKFSFLDHDNINYQTMLVVNDGGKVKIMEVTSNVRSL